MACFCLWSFQYVIWCKGVQNPAMTTCDSGPLQARTNRVVTLGRKKQWQKALDVLRQRSELDVGASLDVRCAASCKVFEKNKKRVDITLTIYDYYILLLAGCFDSLHRSTIPMPPFLHVSARASSYPTPSDWQKESKPSHWKTYFPINNMNKK